jgi:MtN3 and saliva related transmembrane protein
MIWTIIGSIAAFLTMLAFVPQIIKAIKTKSVKDISLFTLLQLSLGISLWIIYGIYLKDAIIILANAVTLAILVMLLYLYFNYGKPLK